MVYSMVNNNSRLIIIHYYEVSPEVKTVHWGIAIGE